ncbi:hypothetical protein [Streptomyces sp. NBC_00645]|uniref:hypothetical protein n=1 Tax=Streptomyces sp. NBC_00645 TaxID=2975795 RepID=UPI0038690BCD
MAVAGLIGAVGIVTDSRILIVAAMVAGPEYGAVVRAAPGIDRRSGPRIRKGQTALTAGAWEGARGGGVRSGREEVSD